ncbi:MAG: hypothetical protein H5U00_06500 [Clostridia bacterium]|nr:hypothetical protein [Clostridia bacterium]
MLEGLSSQSIQSRLQMPANTLKTHLRHLYAKTGTANRKELILLVILPAPCNRALEVRGFPTRGALFAPVGPHLACRFRARASLLRIHQAVPV